MRLGEVSVVEVSEVVVVENWGKKVWARCGGVWLLMGFEAPQRYSWKLECTFKFSVRKHRFVRLGDVTDAKCV